MGVGGDAVVHFAREVDIFRAEAGEGVFDKVEAFVGGAVLDEDLTVLTTVSSYRGVQRRTNGCPLGFTFGPCSEWHDTISTSGGKCLSNAASSGALHDVCPPTIAPTLVAVQVRPKTKTDTNRNIHGPYWATTRSITPASTLYRMKSLILETKCPFGNTVTPFYIHTMSL